MVFQGQCALVLLYPVTLLYAHSPDYLCAHTYTHTHIRPTPPRPPTTSAPRATNPLCIAQLMMTSVARHMIHCASNVRTSNRHIELPSKLLDYFLRSNKSNINQSKYIKCTYITCTSQFQVELIENPNLEAAVSLRKMVTFVT